MPPYQQAKQNRASADNGTKPLCKMSDSDVRLVDGTWAGPNCIAVDANGNPVGKQEKQPTEAEDQQANHEQYIEAHSCMTTMGAEKANSLSDDCNRATKPPHSACNIQQNTCDEIRDATQRGCNSLVHRPRISASLDISDLVAKETTGCQPTLYTCGSCAFSDRFELR
jgi:hypothetical protein